MPGSLNTPMSRWLPLTLAALPAGLFAYLGHFSRLVSDDWIHIIMAREHGLWQYMLYWRQTRGGSYADYFIHSLLGPLDWLAPALFPALIVLIWVPALAWLSRAWDAGCWVSRSADSQNCI